MNRLPIRRIWLVPFLLVIAQLCLYSPRAVADEPPGYARFCTSMTPGIAASASYQAEKFEEAKQEAAGLQPDPTIAQAVAERLSLKAPPVVIARKVELLDPTIARQPGDVTALVGALDPAAPLYWLATLSAAGALQSVAPADLKSIEFTVGFPRSMAAFIIQNDLLGGDATIPRAGCAAIFDAWFGMFPAVNAVLRDAILTEPAQDAALATDVRIAWNALHPDDSGRPGSGALTRDTQRAIGTDPPVTLVFRDAGLPGDGIGEIDLVRIGGTPHTYAIVSGKRPISLEGQTLCVVGDARCSRYYVWP